MNAVYDVFISYASQDRDEVALPLAKELTRAGLNVWFDDAALKAGDSVPAGISAGLTASRVNVVVVSRYSLEPGYALTELRAIVHQHASLGKPVFPIRHRISQDDIVREQALLAQQVNASTEQSIEDLALQIVQLVQLQQNIGKSPETGAAELSGLEQAFRSFTEGNLKQAVNELSSLIATQPEHIDGLVMRARTARMLGDGDMAVRDFKAALAANPENAAVLLLCGLVNIDEGRIADGVRDAEHALTCGFDTHTSRELLYRAQAYIVMQQYRSAQSDIATLLRRDPENQLALSMEVPILQALNKVDQASERANELLRRFPLNIHILAAHAQFYSAQGRYHDALQDVDKALRILPGNSTFLLMRAELQQVSGRTAEALSLVNQVIEREPKKAAALLVRAHLHASLNEPQKAKQDADLLLETAPDNIPALAVRAEILRNSGQFQQATASGNRLLSITPYTPQDKLARANVCALFANYLEALKEANEVLAEWPSQPQALLVRAKAYIALGRKEEAVKDASEVLRVRPNDAAALAVMKVANSKVRTAVMNVLQGFMSNRDS